jgi:hypothetical protein
MRPGLRAIVPCVLLFQGVVGVAVGLSATFDAITIEPETLLDAVRMVATMATLSGSFLLLPLTAPPRWARWGLVTVWALMATVGAIGGSWYVSIVCLADVTLLFAAMNLPREAAGSPTAG